MAQSFWVICRNVSRTFVELCMETPCWCTVLVHQNMAAGKQRKHLEFTFSKKALFFTRERAYMRINKSSNTWNGYTAENQEDRLFSTRQHSNFGLTHCENSEVQIAVFSKWNMLRKWKLVQKIYFLFIFNLVYIRIRKTALFWLYRIWWRHCENYL